MLFSGNTIRFLSWKQYHSCGKKWKHVVLTNLPDALFVFMERNKDMCFHKRAWHVINSHLSHIFSFTPHSLTIFHDLSSIESLITNGLVILSHYLIFQISALPLELSHHYYPHICDIVLNVIDLEEKENSQTFNNISCTTHISIHSLDKHDRDVFCHHLVIYWRSLEMETREILPFSPLHQL